MPREILLLLVSSMSCSVEALSNTSVSDEKCLTIQGDYTILLERSHASYQDARDMLLNCAQLEKCPEHVHTYRLTALSLWNAAATGISLHSVLQGLIRFSKYALPTNVSSFISETFVLYGKLKLVKRDSKLILASTDHHLLDFLSKHTKLSRVLTGEWHEEGLVIFPEFRGTLKVELVKIGYPVEDLIGFEDGEALEIALRDDWKLRDYQVDAVESFYLKNDVRGGSGVLVLPCGAGKTLIGIATMQRYAMSTLIVTPNITAARQWRAEILNRTSLGEDQVAEYSGAAKDIASVTIATYQILTKKNKDKNFSHLGLFDTHRWGLIIYDEVHLLPAPIFQITASIQAKRRLGLTATLVREDKKEDEVFSLIGPKRSDVPWKVLEEQGWIAKARCTELRIPLDPPHAPLYEAAESKERFKIASCNPLKLEALKNIVQRHEGEQILVIGMYLEQLHAIAAELRLDLIDGATPQKSRDRIFADFRSGKIKTLVVSKVANFSVDLPDASVAIEVSGMFGSRQEEAQRLGRILRPKSGKNQAHFYAVVTEDTEEMRFSLNRQLFLVEQGYEYEIAFFDGGSKP